MNGGPPFALIETDSGRTLCFSQPVSLLQAFTLDEVVGVLARLTEARQEGYHIAGYMAYEAGYAFEPRLEALAQSSIGPLLSFGIFDGYSVLDLHDREGAGSVLDLTPSWSSRDYQRRFERVIDYIRAGDVYQVNLTFPLHGRWRGDPVSLYAALRRHQPGRYGALVAFGGETILSLSPELFFETEGRNIRVRPMKGTAPRGRTPDEDEHLARWLNGSEKDRAENLMIVDLLRNDLGRIAEIDSVKVTDLFTVERYPTVLQMTSGIEARILNGTSLPDMFASLFPCGSVTGAPKIRAMEIIRELEDRPRGIYCGSIGYVRPDGSARFSVAIRTATLSPDGSFAFNVGSGVVYDSKAEAEYAECLLKARFLEPLIENSA